MECVVREVEEETGINNIQLKNPLCITYHTYTENEKLILKESHWYVMKINNKQTLIPQTNEDIEKCEWVKIENIAPYLEDSHLSIIEVVKKGLIELNAATNV